MTLQQSPYIRAQRNFPNDSLKTISVEMDRAYIDIADKINSRAIGIFAINFQIVTGEQWYLQGSNKKQQTLRQVYTFSSSSPIPHGITLSQISGFTKIYGTFTDGTNWYPLPYVDPTITNQIGLKVTPLDIVITPGGTAPSISSGIVILEWLSNV